MLQNQSIRVQEKIIRFNQEAEEREAQRRAVRGKRPYLNLITTPIDIKALALVPEERAKDLKIAPVNLVGRELMLAVWDYEMTGVKEETARLESMGFKVDIYIVSISSLKYVWSYYRFVSDSLSSVTGEVDISAEKLEYLKSKLKTLDNFRKELSGVNYHTFQVGDYIEIILGGGMSLGASDIHLEPAKGGAGVRVRIDGILNEVIAYGEEGIPKDFYKKIISRIKLLSGLRLNIINEAQDGRFTIQMKETAVEVRVAIAPAEYGEVAVMRLLDPRGIKQSVEELGFLPHDLKLVEGHLKKSNGMILNTGPTGSGKTTTLYAFLRGVAKDKVKVITIEDPIEYHLEGIEQTQVDESSGYSFADGLRSILRQDPDIILVGEIRDKDTAGIAVNASLTGHLVFSTLHTNDAAGAVPRILDLGVKSHVIGSALSLVIAQRLVRRLCEDCKEEKNTSDKTKAYILGLINELPERIDKKEFSNIKVYHPGEKKKGCLRCGGTGYKGRLGIFELFPIDDSISPLIEKKATMTDIRKAARDKGMATMQEDGILKVIRGETSFEEVERVTGSLEFLE